VSGKTWPATLGCSGASSERRWLTARRSGYPLEAIHEEPAVFRGTVGECGFGIRSGTCQGCAKELKKRSLDSKKVSGNNFLRPCK